MKEHANIIAATILGFCMLVSAFVVRGGLGTVTEAIRRHPVPPSARFPDTIGVRVSSPVICGTVAQHPFIVQVRPQTGP